MAREDPTWGAERIRGELLKVGIRISKRSIQKILGRAGDGASQNGLSWGVFLREEARGIWSCDFFRAVTIGFREISVFVVLDLHTWRVLHYDATEHPTPDWTHRLILRAARDRPPPRFLIHDRDGKFGPAFDAGLLREIGIRRIRTPPRSPKANAHVERAIKTIRRECLDRVLLFGDRHLRAVLAEYFAFYNSMRPHQGLAQEIPERPPPDPGRAAVKARPILGGLHHHHFREAA